MVGDCQSRLASLESSFALLENKIASPGGATDASRVEQQKSIALLLNEQRVCFKQLSLEINETARVSEGARQNFESRLDELAARIKEIVEPQSKAMAAGHDAEQHDSHATVI
jgi:hypothetical protein